jgi:hypothetical protein
MYQHRTTTTTATTKCPDTEEEEAKQKTIDPAVLTTPVASQQKKTKKKHIYTKTDPILIEGMEDVEHNNNNSNNNNSYSNNSSLDNSPREARTSRAGSWQFVDMNWLASKFSPSPKLESRLLSASNQNNNNTSTSRTPTTTTPMSADVLAVLREERQQLCQKVDPQKGRGRLLGIREVFITAYQQVISSTVEG